MDCGDQVKKSKKRISKRKKGVKVVYISTPMKVKTSASKFRDLVQQLTGRDSDTDRFTMEDGCGRSADLDHALLQTSSKESFADDRDSLMLQQQQQQQQQRPWEESLSFESQMFPFSSLFGDDQSNFSYYHQLDGFI